MASDNAVIYLKYPFETTWTDISSKICVTDFDIEERVNGAGIATLSLSNADRWAERALRPGFQLRIYIKPPSEEQYARPDFEGYIPPNYLPSVTGIGTSLELPIVGYFDHHLRRFNRLKYLHGMQTISAMALLNDQVRRQQGSKYLGFAAEGNPTYLVPENMKLDRYIASIMHELRMGMIDESDPLFPRFFHFVTIFAGSTSISEPHLVLVKEPDINGTPLYTMNGRYIMDIEVEMTDSLLTSVIYGSPDKERKWTSRYTHENFHDKISLVEEDIRGKKEDGGLDSSYMKSISLLRYKSFGQSTTVKLTGMFQIPLLSLINFVNTDEDELKGNHIVYGKRLNRSGTITTELLLRNLPDEKI